MNLFAKKTGLLGIDIGHFSTKIVEVDITPEKPIIKAIYTTPTPDAFASHAIAKSEGVATAISSVLTTAGVKLKQVAFSVPGPSAFIKKIRIDKASQREIAGTIQLEAGAVVPYNLNDVRLDYQVLGEASKTQFEVLISAVKNDIVDSFLEVFALAGLEPIVGDIDFFAIQNSFEMNYPELIPSTVALIHIGSRSTIVNICKKGNTLFTGDIPVGGRVVTEAVSQALSIGMSDAEPVKTNETHPQHVQAKDTIEEQVNQLAAEIHRQLSFFWNATGQEGGIDKIMLSGGGAMLSGLTEELSNRTGVLTELMNVTKNFQVAPSVDQELLKKVGPALAVAVGLGIREPNDKIFPEIEE